MSNRMQQAALAAALALGMAAAGPTSANAAVVTVSTNATLSNAPFVITFGGGVATYAFTIASPGGAPGAAVATTGTATVSSFFGGVADFSEGSAIDQNGQIYGFSPFANAAAIPNSPAVDYIGLAYTLSDGLRYGYAQVAGPNLVGYAFETTPNTTITTASITAPVTPVPEPASFVLLMAGMAGLALRGWRAREA